MNGNMNLKETIRRIALLIVPVAMIGMVWWAYSRHGVDEIMLVTSTFAGVIAFSDLLIALKVRWWAE